MKQINNNDPDFEKVYEVLTNPHSGKIKHTFEFYTTPEWHPGTSACWTDCPFSFNIALGEACACLSPEYKKIECPFVKQAVDIWAGGQP